MKKQELESRIKKLEEEVIYLRCRMMELEAQIVPAIITSTGTGALPPIITSTGTGTKTV